MARDAARMVFSFRLARRWPWIVAAAIVLVLTGVMAARRSAAHAALVHADPDAVLSDPALRSLALRLGAGVFHRSCASCHGEDGHGKGQDGAGDLTRSARLYGIGLPSEIEQIVRHGIRSGDQRGWNLASMPAYATAEPYPRYRVDPLTPRDLADVSEYVLSLSGQAHDAAAAARGMPIYAGRGQCFDCHQADAGGDTAIGAPDLTDRFWLYGGTPADVRRSIGMGRAGVSPAFRDRLTPLEQRAVALYAASLIRHPQPRPE